MEVFWRFSKMIENISTLVGNSKLVDSIRRRKNLVDIKPSESSIEEAKARVQRIIDNGRKKKRKETKKRDD
jgi:broad-specificity NMP kinase